MLARILNDKTIQFEQITTPEEVALKKKFSVQSPSARYIDSSEGGFDGWFRKYHESKRTLSRAFLGELRKFCRESGLPLKVMDNRPPPKYPAPNPELVTPDLLPGITLEEYQLRAIRATCTAEVGCIEVPTGGGKGEIAAGITKVHNCPTVIIAEQTVVIEELVERLQLRKVVEDVGMFVGGKRPNGQLVIVGLIQSLVAPGTPPAKTQKDTPESYARKLKAFKTRLKNARTLREMVGKCDLLIIDEADRAVNAQYRNLMRFWFKGRRRYGLSGTYNDPAKPVQNMNLMENLGSIISVTSRSEVQAKGRIIPVALTALAFGNPKNRHDRTAYDIAEKEQVIENVKLHNLIKKLAERSAASTPDHGVVILCESIPLGQTIAALIDPALKPEFIYGGTPKKQRRAAIDAFQKRESRVLIGSKIVKRGMDLKGGCETLIIATGGKLWSEFNQMVGRSVRVNNRKFCQIYDIFHLGSFYLYTHSRARLKHIVGMGYPAKVVFPTTTLDAEAFIKSRFRIPK